MSEIKMLEAELRCSRRKGFIEGVFIAAVSFAAITAIIFSVMESSYISQGDLIFGSAQMQVNKKLEAKEISPDEAEYWRAELSVFRTFSRRRHSESLYFVRIMHGQLQCFEERLQVAQRLLEPAIKELAEVLKRTGIRQLTCLGAMRGGNPS